MAKLLDQDKEKSLKTRGQYLEHLKKHELTWISERAIGKYLKPYPLSAKVLFNFLFTLNPCFPSYSYIISETSLCDNKALKRALDSLKEAKILDWKKGSKLGEKGRSNLYIFNYELLADLSIQYQNKPFTSTMVVCAPSHGTMVVCAPSTMVVCAPSDHGGLSPTKETILNEQLKEPTHIQLCDGFGKLEEEDILAIYGRQLSRSNMRKENTHLSALLKDHPLEQIVKVAKRLAADGTMSGEKCANPLAYLTNGTYQVYLGRVEGKFIDHANIERWVNNEIDAGKLTEGELDWIRANGKDAFKGKTEIERKRLYKIPIKRC